MRSISDLSRLEHSIRNDIERSIIECVRSGWYVMGRNVTAFEEAFAAFIGAGFCVSVGNGTEALEISLRAIGVDRGDQVVTVANAGFYSSIGILACGAFPVYADINPDSYTMDAASLRACITPRTKAVIMTHLYGRIGDIRTVLDVCRERGVPLLRGLRASPWGSLGRARSGLIRCGFLLQFLSNKKPWRYGRWRCRDHLRPRHCGEFEAVTPIWLESEIPCRSTSR